MLCCTYTERVVVVALTETNAGEAGTGRLIHSSRNLLRFSDGVHCQQGEEGREGKREEGRQR